MTYPRCPFLSSTATTSSCWNYCSCLLTGDFLLLLFTLLLFSFQTLFRVIFFKCTTNYVTAPLKNPSTASYYLRIKPRAHKSLQDSAYFSIPFRATSWPHWFYFCLSNKHLPFCLESSQLRVIGSFTFRSQLQCHLPRGFP